MMIVVSRLPLATRRESGDHATEFTLALWKPHSLLWASCVNERVNEIESLLRYENKKRKKKNGVSCGKQICDTRRHISLSFYHFIIMHNNYDN